MTKQTVDDPTPDTPATPADDVAAASQTLESVTPQSPADAELIQADEAILAAEEQLIPASPLPPSTEPHYDQETGAFA